MTAEKELFKGRIGDEWGQTYTMTLVRTWDQGTLEIDLRQGDTADLAQHSAPSASSYGTSPTITTTGTAFPTTFAWQIADSVTADLSPGTYWIAARCKIDGKVTTFLAHAWIATPRLVGA